MIFSLAEAQGRLQVLEEKLAHTRKLLAEAQTECAAYRRSYQDSLLAALTKEQLLAFAEPEEEHQCQRLDQFLGELEDIVRQGPRA
jgi:hypothetical protein